MLGQFPFADLLCAANGSFYLLQGILVYAQSLGRGKGGDGGG